MSDIAKALLWALVLLLVAAGRRTGAISDKMAATLFIILPILALLALRGRGRSASRRTASQ